VGVPRDSHAAPPPARKADANGPAEMHDLPARPAVGTAAGPSDIRARDRKAFTKLILEHDERLRGLAYRILGDRGLMDDALQDAYAKAFAALPTFRRRSSAATWLYRITYTTCIDELRRRRRLAAVPNDLLEGVADPAPDLGDELAERDRLATALAALPPEQRAAVLLVDRDGFDYKTVAEILDVPFGTAASRVSAARHALRRALGSAAGEEQR
jgi:RNA polymerase sigma-70 factor (ECF subfamily)